MGRPRSLRHAHLPRGYIDEPTTCEFAVMDDAALGTGCGDASTAPVGSKPAGNSAQGLVDMSGNVAEIAHSDHVIGGFKVSRGGNWTNGAVSTKSLFRTSTSTTYSATSREAGVGFRRVRDDG